MDEETPPSPVAERRPSLGFSWATLGFILGALFVILLPPRRSNEPGARPVVEVAEPPPKPLPPLRLTTIEDVFEAWSQYAVWSRETTEVALFDPSTNEFSDCYQVVRAENAVYFFRSIPHLNRPVLTHGVPENAPLRFTETEEQRQQWLHETQDENDRQFRKAMEAQPGVPQRRKQP